jgi:hypothetical protein
MGPTALSATLPGWLSDLCDARTDRMPVTPHSVTIGCRTIGDARFGQDDRAAEVARYGLDGSRTGRSPAVHVTNHVESPCASPPVVRIGPAR